MGEIRNYLDLPLRELLEDTAARTPTPGGGSIAAVVGALAASLGRMVVNFTVGKQKYAAHEPRLRELMGELQRAGAMFMQLMNEDMAAYERYAASRKRDDEREQERALATAVAVPMEMLALAAVLSERLDESKTFVNSYLLSDLQTAILLVYAAGYGASTHIISNLAHFEDSAEADRLRAETDDLLRKLDSHRASVLAYRV